METKVKWFNDEKGYGIIKYEDNGDVIIRYSAGKDEYFQIELVKTENGYKRRKY